VHFDGGEGSGGLRRAEQAEARRLLVSRDCLTLRSEDSGDVNRGASIRVGIDLEQSVGVVWAHDRAPVWSGRSTLDSREYRIDESQIMTSLDADTC
jgi:hypothetical protein